MRASWFTDSHLPAVSSDDKGSLWGLFISALIPFIKALLSWLITNTLIDPTCQHHTLGMRIWHVNFGRDTNIQPTAVVNAPLGKSWNSERWVQWISISFHPIPQHWIMTLTHILCGFSGFMALNTLSYSSGPLNSTSHTDLSFLKCFPYPLVLLLGSLPNESVNMCLSQAPCPQELRLRQISAMLWPSSSRHSFYKYLLSTYYVQSITVGLQTTGKIIKQLIAVRYEEKCNMLSDSVIP